VLRLVLLATAPALFWLWLFWRRDRWQREPKSLVLKVFALGAIAAAPAWLLEAYLPGPGGPLFDNFVRVALVEEACKLLPMLLVYRRREFDEPMDGIVYMVAVALGFATVENVLYALHSGEAVIWVRAFTSTLAHLGFSGLLGYAVGRAKFAEGAGTGTVLGALAGVTLLHGGYDLLLHAGGNASRIALAVLVPAVLLALWYACNLASRASPWAPPTQR